MEISIFNYETPAMFLMDAWNKKRAFNKGFTLRAWANQLGISSHGTFYQMVKGMRPLPKKYVQPISKSLKLRPKESMYLETLIDLSKAKSLEHKAYYRDRLRELAPGKKLDFYEMDTFHFFKNPINGAIIELANLKDFKSNPFWIKERLTIKTSLRDIEKSINLLLKLNLISKDEEGNFKRTKEHIYTKQDIKNEAIQEYHKNILSFASEQIELQTVDQREYNSTSMGIKKSLIPEIKDEIRDFLASFVKKYEAIEGEADEIYQVGIQFFALTNSKDITK